MADLSDVTAYLYDQAVVAVYPNGTTSPSAANMDCRIFEGWPIAAQLDLDIAGEVKNATTGVVSPRPGGVCANVSIYPLHGLGTIVYQILDQTYVISEPTIATTVSLSGDVISVAGTLAAGEFLTLVIDGDVVCSQGGANVAAMLSALATQAQGFGYAATSTATTLTIPFGHSLVINQGGQAVLGKVIHRQRHCVMVTVWAPNRVARNQLAIAIDGLIKQANKVTMPDTSQAIVVYSRTNVSDEQQAATIYRRDLIYDVDYATVQQFPGYTITSVAISIERPDGSLIIDAITGGDGVIDSDDVLDFSDPDNSQFLPLIG